MQYLAHCLTTQQLNQSQCDHARGTCMSVQMSLSAQSSLHPQRREFFNSIFYLPHEDAFLQVLESCFWDNDMMREMAEAAVPSLSNPILSLNIFTLIFFFFWNSLYCHRSSQAPKWKCFSLRTTSISSDCCLSDPLLQVCWVFLHCHQFPSSTHIWAVPIHSTLDITDSLLFVTSNVDSGFSTAFAPCTAIYDKCWSTVKCLLSL